jgi:hypothetical protein
VKIIDVWRVAREGEVSSNTKMFFSFFKRKIVLEHMIKSITGNYFGTEQVLLLLSLFSNQVFVSCLIQVVVLVKEFTLLLKMAKVVDTVS